MSESRQEEVQEESRTPAGPGPRLRETREARGLSLEDVAHELRLNPQLIQALEEDDYEHLPPVAFVTGYLRSYARLLELPEQEIIQRFEQAGKEPPKLVPHGRDTQVRSSDLPVRLVTYVLVIGLAVLLGLWWFSERQPLEFPAPEGAETEVLPGEEQPLGDSRLEAPVEPAAPGTEPEEAAVPEPQAAPESSAEAPAADETVEPAPVEEPAPAVSDTQGLQLKLVFSANSWVDISDATGRQLAGGLIKKGQELTLNGKPPYRVFLGYAPGVNIYYRGEEFDQSAFVRGNETARFRVGSASDSPRSEAR